MFGEKILYAQSGHLYLGSQTDGFTQVDETPISGDNAYHQNNELSIIQAGAYFWLVDGENVLRRVNVDTGVIDEPTETGGTFPQDGDDYPRLLWLYRDRLFQARLRTDPRNYFASKSGDFLNYDYGSLLQTGAFAGNNTQQAGLLGDILTAAIPYGDNSCVMGMSNSVAVMRGDPKSGGSIDTVSREIGIVRPTAWCRDPDGKLYFMSRDGLYVMEPNGTPQPMSRGRLDETLGAIDFTQIKIHMAWDPGELGVKIYLVPLTADDPTKMVYWFQRKNSFWVDSIAPAKGPTAVCPVNGATKRVLLLGCWDGYLRLLDETAHGSDDGDAIESQVWIGPNQLFGQMVNGKITQHRFLWGTVGTANVVYKYFVGDDPVTATAAATAGTDPEHARTITLGGYQALDRQRVRGASQIIELSNTVLGKTWQYEKGHLMIAPSGRVRT